MNTTPISAAFREAQEPPATKNVQRKKVLVVDDNALIVKTLSFKLTSGGYDVLTAADGSEAVSAVRREKPDLIVLDISFPPDVAHGGGVAWDGFVIINWLRRIEEAQNTPIIVITGGEPEKYEARAKAAGAVGFFRKPIDHTALVQLVKHTLGDFPPPK